MLVNPSLTTLLDLGTATWISKILSSNGNVVVQDVSGHWILMNYATNAKIASGEQGPDGLWPIDMEGSILAVGVANGLEVRSAVDGHLLAIITSPIIDPVGATPPASWWRLASDGSYICAGSSASLTAWSTSGNVLFTRTGDYSHAKLFAGPGKIQIALGPAGTAVVETVSVPDGSSSVGATFSGSFNTWFLDGSRFLTNLSNGVWTYDIAVFNRVLSHSRHSMHWVGKETGCGRLSLILRQLPFIRSEVRMRRDHTAQTPVERRLRRGTRLDCFRMALQVLKLSISPERAPLRILTLFLPRTTRHMQRHLARYG